jgi:queuosine precursor transporter
MKTEKSIIELKYLYVITGVYVGALVLVPSMASKIISIGPFNIVASTLVFPITFIANDVLTEVYGYKRSRKVIWTGLVCQIFAAAMYWVIKELPHPETWLNQEAYETILGTAPRIALASLMAYFFGEFANSVVISKMKYSQDSAKGLKQGWRFVASTIVGEAVDSVIFSLIAFSYVLPLNAVVNISISIWIFKVLYEIIALPFSIPFSNWLKKEEGIDELDFPNITNYNPFKINS